MAKLSNKELGDRGEALVIQWLQQQGWEVLARQWHCRWGELDIVAYRSLPEPCLAFVEVKTRQPQNWDAGGRLAMTPQKQQKLWRSAELYLSEHPQWGDLPCRFDIALVVHGPLVPSSVLAHQRDETGYWGLADYLENAFQQP